MGRRARRHKRHVDPEARARGLVPRVPCDAAEAQAEEDLKPKEVRMSQRTSKYMYRQRKEKNLYQATRNVDKLW